MPPIPAQCERARVWASLRADGELSELESALLDGHLGRCPDCRAFAHGTAEVAATLRTVPLETVRLHAPAPPSRSGSARLRGLAAVVALVAVAAVAGSASGPSDQGAPAKPVSMVAGVDSPDGLRQLRRPGLVAKPRAFLPRNRFVPGVPV